MFVKENRRFLNKTDEWIRPESTAAKVTLVPLTVPLATGVLATDLAIVHPACSLRPAWDDVYDLYWKPREMDWLRKSIMIPVITALTPPTYLVDLTGRILFPIESES